MIDIAVSEQSRHSNAEQNLWDAVVGLVTERASGISETVVSGFELLVTPHPTQGAQLAGLAPAERSPVHEINASGSPDLDRWANLLAMAEMNPLSSEHRRSQ